MLDDAQVDRSPRTATYGSSTVDETITVDIEALAIVGEHKAVVLGLVEPQHRSSQSRTACRESDAVGKEDNLALARAARSSARRAILTSPSSVACCAWSSCNWIALS